MLSDLRAFQQGLPLQEQTLALRLSHAAKRLIVLGVLGFAICLGIAASMFAAFKHDQPSPVQLNPLQDAERLDNLSAAYFAKGDYERAIPLLEFGVKTYMEHGHRLQGEAESSYLADQEQHIGKCYLRLGKPGEAVPHYQRALKIYKRWGNYAGGGMTEAVTDYADVLRQLEKGSEADAMLTEYKRTNNISTVP